MASLAQPDGRIPTIRQAVMWFTEWQGTAGSSLFTINSLPAYITAFTTAPQVATYPNATVLEGITNINSLTNPQAVSITALFVNPASTSQPLQAAKVRAH